MDNNNETLNIATEVREKYLNNQLEPYRTVVVLVAMAKAGEIAEESIAPILTKAFLDYEEDLIKGLTTAREIIDTDLIDEIVGENKIDFAPPSFLKGRGR